MSKTIPIGVRVGPSTKERILKLACYRPDGLTVTVSQVVRAALEIGLFQMEKAARKGERDEHR